MSQVTTNEIQHVSEENDLDFGDGHTLSMTFGGYCTDCGVPMEAVEELFGGLEYPDCSRRVAPTIYPSEHEGGEHGDSSIIMTDPFEVGGSIYVSMGVSGSCGCGGELMENVEESRFDNSPLACSDCDTKIGWTAKHDVV